MPPKHRTTSFQDASWDYGPSNHPIVVEHRLTVLEVNGEWVMEEVKWIREKVTEIDESISEPRRPQWLEALSMLREVLPYCIGLAMLAGAIAGKVEWSSIGEALK